jgi:hypothetical protein
MNIAIIIFLDEDMSLLPLVAAREANLLDS